MGRSLNGCYTCLLKAALNIKWWQHIPNTDLYLDLPKVGDKVAARRMNLVEYCIRHPELPAEKVLLWGLMQKLKEKTTRHSPGHLEERCRLESTEELGTCVEDQGNRRIHTRAQTNVMNGEVLF